MRRLQFSCLVLVLLAAVSSATVIFYPAHAWAEPAKSGRLGDGRAFRMDQNGYRIIDELAELEVTVSDLERQNAALETETEHKQKIIEQLRQGKCGGGALAESDLSAKRSLLPPPAEISCNSQTEPLQQRIADLQARIAQQNEATKVKESSIRFGEQQSASLRDEVDLLKKQLSNAPTSEIVEQLSQRNRSLESSITDLQHQLAASQSKAEELTAGLEQERSAAAAAARAALAVPPQAQAGPQIGSLRGEVQPRTAKWSAAADDSGATIADQAEIGALRTEFKGKLAKIDSKIGDRKRLLDSLQSRRIGVTLGVQQLRTADGRSLDSLRMSVTSLSANSEPSSIRSGLQQIEKILDDDLALLHRLGKI